LTPTREGLGLGVLDIGGKEMDYEQARNILAKTLRKRGMTHVHNDVNDMFASLRELRDEDVDGRLRISADHAIRAIMAATA